MKFSIKVFFCILMVSLLVACGGKNESKNASPQAEETKETEKVVSMIDVTDMPLSEAEEKLKNLGLNNIDAVKDDLEWPDNRYIITEQSIASGTEVKISEKISLKCAKKCDLYLDLTSASNLFLDTYDMDIYLNDEMLGSVANGEVFTKLVSILEGDYEVIAYKSGNNSVKATKKIKVDGDITFKSSIAHGGNITFKDATTTTGTIGAEITMINVTGRVLQEAMTDLSNSGFINVREEPFSDIWDKNNWIVVNQGVAAGSIIDKNEKIQLDCIKLDKYFKENYVGKNLADVQKMAEESGFEIRYQSTEGKPDIGTIISNLSQDNKLYWTVDEAYQYGGANKTAVVSVTYQGTPEEREAWEQARKESEAAEAARKESEAAERAKRESEAAEERAKKESEFAEERARRASVKASEAAEASEERARKESEFAEERARRASIAAEKANEETTKAKETKAAGKKAKPTYYSTNDLDTAKKGNTGVFAYKSRGGTYENYYVIDFDNGYVYFFTNGNGDTTCERLKIQEGNLNDGVKVTYHDYGRKWSNYLHFKWKNKPEHLILVDQNYFETDFYCTDLSDALLIKSGKKIYDY